MVWIVKENVINTRSVLAKLLAKENITVQHGNYQTAFFDVKNRVLGLPIWKDKGKDVYDMLVGHEVGHALYSPMFDPKKLPAPHAYVNIVEDIRIERKIQSTYPGLVRCFQQAYSVLSAEDFFGVKGKKLDELSLPDRINIKAKLGSLIDIKFDPSETAIVNQCFAVETWQDTLKASEDLYKFCKKQAKKQKQQQQNQQQSGKQSGKQQQNDPSQQPSSEPDSDKKSGKSDKQKDSDKQKSSKSEDKSKDKSGEEDDGEQAESGKSDKKEQDLDNETPASSGIGSDDDNDDSDESDGESSETGDDAGDYTTEPPPVTTVNSFDKKAKEIIDRSDGTLRTIFAKEPSEKEVFDRICSYKELFANREKNPAYKQSVMIDANSKNFTEFMAATNKHVAMLKKEFDMRKAAYQYSRATVARSGVLNVDRLHSYRIDDDIFLSVTQLANAKNHGMVMFVDYSGSMSTCIAYVLKHLINLTVFCKAVGIPFRVYGFTSANGYKVTNPYDSSNEEGKVIMNGLTLVELVSSEMNKTDYRRAIHDLYIRASQYGAYGTYETLGSTPLNETMLAAHKIIKKLQSEYPVQKWITMFLTDGEGGNVYTTQDSSYNDKRLDTRSAYSIEMVLNGRRMRSPIWAHEHMEALIDNLRITTGSKVIGFFIPGTNSGVKRYATRALSSLSHNTRKGINEKELMDNFSKEKCVCVTGAYKYDEYFIVSSGRDLDVKEDALEITEDMSRGRIATKFMDYTKSKKVNRVFVTKFASAIA